MTGRTTYPYELPKGWVWVNVSQVAALIRGVSYPKEESSKEAEDGYIPILRANNIDGELNFDDLVYVPRKRVKDEQLVRKFDILLAMSSGSRDLVGKAAQANRDFDGGFGAFCGLIRVAQELEGKYAGFFFRSPRYHGEIFRLSSGVNINNLRRDHIESMPFPLPPLPEQHRIAAKIEELFPRLDSGIDALRTVKAQLKRYRQAVLKHAFEGRLTAEWRQAHKHQLEPASVLLEPIKQERHKTRGGKHRELPPPDVSRSYGLPGEWVWTRLGQVGDVLAGCGFPKNRQGSTTGDLPFFKVADISRACAGGERLLRTAMNYVSAQVCAELGGTPLRQGSVVFAKIGEAIKLNRRAILAQDSLVDNNVAGVHFALGVDNMFGFYFLSTIRLEEYSRATTVPSVRKSDLECILLPLPPLQEQQRIVEEIERRFSVVDQLENAVDRGIKQAQHLRHSILKKAFEGKLVPQDPNDEPAGILLERIREERTRLQARGKPR